MSSEAIVSDPSIHYITRMGGPPSHEFVHLVISDFFHLITGYLVMSDFVHQIIWDLVVSDLDEG
jgi:hypothetical protein